MALRRAEAGPPVAGSAASFGFMEATLCRCRKGYGDVGVPELRESKQLRDENGRLKRLWRT